MPSTPENSAGESHDKHKSVTVRGGKKKAKKAKTKLRTVESEAQGEAEGGGVAFRSMGGDAPELLDPASPSVFPVAVAPEPPSWNPSPAPTSPEQLPEEPDSTPPSPAPTRLRDPLPDFSPLLPGLEQDADVDGLSPSLLPEAAVEERRSASPSETRAASAVPEEQSSLVDAQVQATRQISDVSLDQNSVSTAVPMRPGNPSKSSNRGSPFPSPPNRDSRRFGYEHASNALVDVPSVGSQGSARRPALNPRHQPHTFHGGDPPLPHLPQAHFYSAPPAETLQARKRGKRSSRAENIHFYGLDSLAGAGGDISGETDNVLLVGGDGTLDVFRVERDRLAVIGHLRGLRGQVTGAKIVPRLAREDTSPGFRPLVVLTLHGPAHGRTGDGNSYQTTVEVFSLKAWERMVTLFATPTAAVPSGTSNSPFFAPPGAINLRVDANARYITVASGSSGELWIFSAGQDAPKQQGQPPSFRCLAKIWTAVQPTSSTSSSPSEWETVSGSLGHVGPPSGRSVYSLSHRWLAYVPARPSSQPAIQGEVLLDTNSRPPGLSNHTAPPQPQVTCTVDTPDGDGIFNRVAREVTQEVLKGAKWVGDQGLQAWRSYWNKSSQADPSTGLPGINQGRESLPHQHYSNAQNFPPTHAHAHIQPQSGSETVLVSILDLARLERSHETASQRLNPIATFQAPPGCSFLSFAPGGLHLLTASKKGDVQFVWDLMKIGQEKLGSTSPTSAPKNLGRANPTRRGPHVRQIAHFTRMTPATIVDVAWTTPSGERLAIITEKGTVHMFDIPPSAFQWPPPRRPVRANSSSSTEDKNASRGNALYSATGAAGNTMSAAVKMVNSTAQPLLAAARGRRSSSGAGALGGGSSGSAAYSKGAQGGRIVAQGLSKSLGAATETFNVLRSIGENRLHLPGSGSLASPGCVRWLTGREAGLIGLAGDGIVRVHEVRTKASSTKGGKRQSLVRGQLIEHDVPNLVNRPLSSQMDPLEAETDLGDETSKVVGYWNVRPRSGEARRSSYNRQHPLSYAEIETNTPYQPFHTDRRVRLFTYEDAPRQGAESGTSDHQSLGTDVSVFGQKIPATRVYLGGNAASEHDDGVLGPMENVVQRGRASDEFDELVITTRRRKRIKDGMGEDGFFEDDCDVLDFASDRV